MFLPAKPKWSLRRGVTSKAGEEIWAASKSDIWPQLTIREETGTSGPSMTRAWIQPPAWRRLGMNSSPEPPEMNAALYTPWLCSYETHRINRTCLKRRPLGGKRGLLLQYSVLGIILRDFGGCMHLNGTISYKWANSLVPIFHKGANCEYLLHSKNCSCKSCTLKSDIIILGSFISFLIIYH